MSWFRRKNQDLDDELQSHLKMAMRERIDRGESPTDAEAAARREFGNVLLVEESTRAAWGWSWLERLTQDIRFALRMLIKAPGFALVAIITLALGIGATTAVFSVVDSVLLRPLPFRDPQQLVMLFSHHPTLGDGLATSPPDFRDLRERMKTLDSLSAINDNTFNLSGRGEAERLLGEAVSAEFFRTVGVNPILGRAFHGDEEQWGHHRVAIVSDAFFRSHLGGRQEALGTTLTLNREPYTIIGVLPPGFRVFDDRQIYVPLAFAPKDIMNTRNNHFLRMIGRLKPGVSMQTSLAEAKGVMADIEKQFPENKAISANMKPLRDQLVGDVRPALLVLLGAVTFVLLIACANIANLLLARAARREREVALRAALGAGRSRLAQQFVTESIVLAVIGGGMGLGLAYLALKLVPLAGDTLPQFHRVALNGRVLAFTLVASLATSIFFGVAPAIRAWHVNLSDSLKSGGRGSQGGESNRRLRAALVIGEVAVALVLLVAAGLMLRSFERLMHVDSGFDPHHVLTFELNLPSSYGTQNAYTAPPRVSELFDTLLSRIQTLPGVQSAGATSSLPLQGENWGKYVNFNDRPEPPSLDKVPVIQYRAVDGDFFRAMGIRILSGRTFTASDNHDAPAVAVVNRTFARRFWPNQDAIGKQISADPPSNLVPANLIPPDYKVVWFTVVGVVDDARYGGLSHEAQSTIYAPITQGDWSTSMSIAVRTSVDPLSLFAPIRRELAQLDNALPMAGVSTMDDIVSTSVAQPKLESVLLGLFAALALLLATVGIYGVLSYSVTQRTHEIGVRMAVGADKERVLRMVVRDGLRLAVIGLAIGLGLALLATRMLSGLLFGVSPSDPATYVAISVILVGIAILASYIPARRATNVDPMIALRTE
jgi:putative ABC transport system permease protein